LRFRLRTAFSATALFAVACASIAWLLGLYYVQVRRVNAALSNYPEIDRVWFCTNDDVTLEVEQLYFSTVSEPHHIFMIDGIDGVSVYEIRRRLDRALRERRQVALPRCAELQ
jgi:hypothetical protein